MAQKKLNIIRLFAMEEDEIYQEIFRTILPSRAPIELIDISSVVDTDTLRKAILEQTPDVVLISIKKPETAFIHELEQIRIEHPEVGLVLLLESCNARDIQLLRTLALKGNGGMALFAKHFLTQLDRLCKAIPAVSQGQVILDLTLATFMFSGKPGSRFLEQCTPRELEIMNLLAHGYTNAAIAQALFIDIKTVERHLNSMYGKLKEDPEFSDKHLRVSVAKLYLENKNDYQGKENLLIRD